MLLDAGLWSVMGIGFMLGIKHAIEPDHVIAVSTIASRTRSLWRAAFAGAYWGIGHTATLFAAGSAFFALSGGMPEKWSMSLEFLVGIMLVYLGVTSFRYRCRNVHSHDHRHGDMTYAHFHDNRHGKSHEHDHRGMPYAKATLIGVVHGLAGSAAMALLAMSTVDTYWQAMLYILVFGAGTVLGMLLFMTAIGLPFVLTVDRVRLNGWLVRVTGAVSALYGVYYMYNLGVTEGLFRLWLG